MKIASSSADGERIGLSLSPSDPIAACPEGHRRVAKGTKDGEVRLSAALIFGQEEREGERKNTVTGRGR